MRFSKRFLLSLLLFFLLAKVAEAFSPFGSPKTKYDSSYIIKYPKYLALTPVLIYRDFTLGFASDKKNGRRVDYSPNLSPQWGIGLDYNWLSLELTSSWGMDGDGNQTKGKTYILGIRGGLTKQRWVSTGSIQYFKGMYISNPNVFQSNFLTPSNAVYLHRGDIGLVIARGSYYYMLNNKKYSYAACLYITTERQLKSAGSVLLGGTVNYINISADSSLIPKAIVSDFSPSNLVKKSDFLLMLFNVGYAHTFVIKKRMYLNSDVIFGMGPVSSRIKPQDESYAQERTDLGVALDLRLGVGYNGENMYGGVSVNSVSLSGTAGEEASINNSFYVIRFFVGYRFHIKHIFPILG